MKNKTPVFLDADDTILESSKTVIGYLNVKYQISPPKRFSDLKDWGYTSIYRGVTPEEIEAIYNSDEFFENVTAVAPFVVAYERLKEDFDFRVVTIGTVENLDRKERWFKRNFPLMTFIGIETTGLPSKHDKSVVNMEGAIQIDDRVDALLSTKASCKILLQNNISVAWNTPPPGANLYIVQNWNEIAQILDFTVKCPSWYAWEGFTG